MINSMKSILGKTVKLFKEDKRAFTALIIAGIMAAIIGAAMIYVGLYVTVTISSSIPGVNDSGYNTSLGSVKSNINTAFSVLGLCLLILGFAIIIQVLKGGFGGGGDVR